MDLLRRRIAARRRRHRVLQKSVEQEFDAEVVHGAAEINGRLLSGTDGFEIKRMARAIQHRELLGDFVIRVIIELFSDGRIFEGNFDQYPMLSMADVPKVLTVHFGGLSGHDRFNEVGEPPVGPIGPAVANAIFRATGKRIRTMPFRRHDLSWT